MFTSVLIFWLVTAINSLDMSEIATSYIENYENPNLALLIRCFTLIALISLGYIIYDSITYYFPEIILFFSGFVAFMGLIAILPWLLDSEWFYEEYSGEIIPIIILTCVSFFRFMDARKLIEAKKNKLQN